MAVLLLPKVFANKCDFFIAEIYLTETPKISLISSRKTIHIEFQKG